MLIKHSAKYEACGRGANKARGEAECFINISAARLVLYFSYSTRGYALTYVTQSAKRGLIAF